MILAKKEILKAVREGRIRIDPFEPSSVGPCSVDFSLGNEFRVFEKRGTEVDLVGGLDYLKQTKPKRCLARYTLQPGELILGVTREKLGLSNGLCGWIQGRSRIARMGVMVHVSSSLVQPGVDNHQVLEIINLSPNPIVLRPGVKVCQIVFEELSSEAEYAGEFAKQTKP